jgi:hypothetical protein
LELDTDDIPILTVAALKFELARTYVKAKWGVCAEEPLHDKIAWVI